MDTQASGENSSFDERIERVIEYHNRTKHHFGRSARSAGYLDWSTQPDPFRRFIGARLVPLSHQPTAVSPIYDDLFRTEAVSPAPLNSQTVSQFFRDSLALSAWKEFGGERWALRVNPSSGNLHPTEGYLIGGPIDGLCSNACVYHYAPKEHALELRMEIDPGDHDALFAPLPEKSFLIGLSSIHWREAWKYGERAYRYCHHDVGHALGAFSFSAAVLGWKVKLLEQPAEAEIARLLGTDRQQGPEQEHADCLALVYRHDEDWESQPIDPKVIEKIGEGEWLGQPNVLSPGHVKWEIIDGVAEAAQKPRTEAEHKRDDPNQQSSQERSEMLLRKNSADLKARTIIHRRRSAVAMDGKTAISKEAFFLMLSRTLPLPDASPFDCLPWSPAIHLLLFVHRVEGVAPGLYFLVRNRSHLAELRESTRDRFAWKSVPEAPADLPLFLLQEEDVRELAATVSCGQNIAGDGAFSAAMLAEFEPRIRRIGPWVYPRLFWETGFVGQVLYLEAEAANVQATGIGCFFDDPVHEVLGIRDHRWQSLYHFTVGGPVIDDRLTTLPPYGDRK